ncbi:hypothetical protein Mapa_017606 [Marchantia paleacea]|nr:hypothetical protein Mapa_017606 [Marchantia paleacea]
MIFRPKVTSRRGTHAYVFCIRICIVRQIFLRKVNPGPKNPPWSEGQVHNFWGLGLELVRTVQLKAQNFVVSGPNCVI